jgi:hypothetical protein
MRKFLLSHQCLDDLRVPLEQLVVDGHTAGQAALATRLGSLQAQQACSSKTSKSMPLSRLGSIQQALPNGLAENLVMWPLL